MSREETILLDGCQPWPHEIAAFYRETGCWRGKHLGRYCVIERLCIVRRLL